MLYYKDTNNKPFAFEDNVTGEIITKVEATHNTTLTEITKADYDAITAPAFTELQAKKVNEIKSAFTNSLANGYTCSNNITMDADITSVNTLKSGYDLATIIGQTTMDIRDYNNIVHTNILISDVFTMITELGVNINTQLVKKWTLEDQINLAITQAELDLIVF